MSVLLDAILQVLESRIIRQIGTNVQETLDLMVREYLKIGEHVFKDSLFGQLFGQNFNEAIAMNYLYGRISADQVGQVLSQLVREFGSMFLLRVLVVPNYGTGPFLDHSAIYVLTVLLHYLPYCLHPMQALNFEKFGPLVSISHEPIATFSGNPEIFTVH